MNKQEIEELFYIKKEYSKIKELIKNSKDSWSFRMLAKIALIEGNIDEALKYFNEASDIYGCAYCQFLNGNLEEAEIQLNLVENLSPSARWLKSLCSIIGNKKVIHPTYFEVRNFYEQDLDMLFKFKRYDWAEKLISLAPYFETINKEIYKYNARILINNGYIENAEPFLKNSLEIFYKDPETHFLLGFVYEHTGDIKKAASEYKKSIEVNSGYYPAEKRLYNLNYSVK